MMNKRFFKYFALIIVFFSITSCAIRGVSIVGNNNYIDVEINKQSFDGKMYLVDAKNEERISTGKLIKKNTLQFKLPDRYNRTDVSLKILDQTSKPLYFIKKDNFIFLKYFFGESNFTNPIWNDYLLLKSHIDQLLELKNDTILLIKSLERKIYKFQDVIDRKKNSLIKNDAYNNKRCIEVPLRNLPSKPYKSCEYYEGKRNSSALCAKMAFGAEGCGIVAKKMAKEKENLELYNFFLSPACAAVTAKKFGQNYSGLDAANDVITGIIDDVGDNLWNSDSLLGNFFGIVTKGIAVVRKFESYDKCRNNVFKRCNYKYEKWIYNYWKEKNRPQILIGKCKSDKNTIEIYKNLLEKTEFMKQYYSLLLHGIIKEVNTIQNKLNVNNSQKLSITAGKNTSIKSKVDLSRSKLPEIREKYQSNKKKVNNLYIPYNHKEYPMNKANLIQYRTLKQKDKFKAEINITCFDKDEQCGTFHFHADKCGGTLTFLGVKNSGFIFNENLTYGNCQSNCKLWLSPGGDLYSELCKGEIVGTGYLKY